MREHSLSLPCTSGREFFLLIFIIQDTTVQLYSHSLTHSHQSSSIISYKEINENTNKPKKRFSNSIFFYIFRQRLHQFTHIYTYASTCKIGKQLGKQKRDCTLAPTVCASVPHGKVYYCLIMEAKSVVIDLYGINAHYSFSWALLSMYIRIHQVIKIVGCSVYFDGNSIFV